MNVSMWKSLFIVWISFFSLHSLAQATFKCGEYEIQGVLQKVEGKNVLKLFEGSANETILSLAPDLEELAEVHLGEAVTLKGRMREAIKNSRGAVESNLSEEEIKTLAAPDKAYSERFMRDDIKERVPDPLHPESDSSIKLVKEIPCGALKPSPPAKKKAKKK